jgi:hypothetical protein
MADLFRGDMEVFRGSGFIYKCVCCKNMRVAHTNTFSWTKPAGCELGELGLTKNLLLPCAIRNWLSVMVISSWPT